MNFFINSSYNEQNSGIEHAQIKRSLLFRKNKTPFKLLFLAWNPLLHHYLNQKNIKDIEILNVFDYFQNTEQVVSKKIYYSDIDFGVSNLKYNEEKDKNRYIVFQDNNIVGRINYFPKKISNDKQVKSVEFFDGFGNLYRVDFYDLRGFVSLVQWYTPDNKIGTEVWYSIDGRPVVETYHRKNALGELKKSGWKTISPNGTVKIFDTLSDVFLQFFNEINDKYFDKSEPNIFIMDRSDDVEEQLQLLNQPAFTALHLHNSHAGDAQKPDTSILNNNYEYSLNDINRYDAVISATHKQTDDVIKRFHPLAKTFTIPVGVIPDNHFNKKEIPMNERKFGQILVTARIAPEKQLDQLIRAIGIAKKIIPELSLDMYGYIDHSNNDIAMKKINKAIDEYNLKDCVHIHSYVQNVAKVQKEAQVYGLTSVMEGFNLALMEAMSQGDIGLTYDVNYGPNELVKDQVNGYVVDYGDYKTMAQRLITIFSNKDLMDKLSKNAYHYSKRYSEDSVWQDWKDFLDFAKEDWINHKMKNYKPDITNGIQKLD